MLPMPLEVQEGYLEVREVATQQVITVIDVLSPANKRPGRGRDAYLYKRDLVLDYEQSPVPAMAPEDNAWLRELLNQTP
ncbi:hypothetical protein XM38_045610 [Halomicronema hongdechloris C2206]|uniref:Uncharacterized protein n=1 Tax=Halomicronema hongdechloris C2206 TaxID=1641165 RepID=A0A1Z3HTE8_9CYAN|nr:hypothetical protein XM38_045610 [Halomicronema hongdechloris C2206]